MTVPVPAQLEYISDGDGVTTSFSYPIRFLDKAEIVVILRDADDVDTVQTLNTDYTIAGSSWPSGGNVVFAAAPPNGVKVVRVRSTVAKQVVDLSNKAKNNAESVEQQLDRLTMVAQDLGGDAAELSSRAVLYSRGYTGRKDIADPEAGKILGWNADGTRIVNKEPVSAGAAGAAGAVVFAADTTADIRDFLDLVPGVDVQTHSANLDELSLVNAGTAGKTNLQAENFADALATPVDGTVTDAKLPAFGGSSPTADKISFTQTGTGAVARPLIAKIKDGPVSLEDFGYVSGNALTALNNAIACGQPIRLGPKVYDVNGALDIPTNRDFFLSGWGYGASALRFTGVTRGLEVVQDDYTHATHIRDMNILTTQQEPGTGLKVTYSKADSITNRSLRRCSIIDVDVRGELDQSQGWATGIHLVDVHSADIIRPLVTGRRDAAVTGRNSFNKMANGIRITGADTPTFSSIPSTILISHPKIDCAQNAIYSEGEVEGMMVETPILVGVINGIVTRYTTTRPWTKISGGHVNFFDAAVDLQNNPQSNIDDMILYKFEQTDAVSVGIILRTCDDSEINNILLMNQATSVALNGDWHGIQVDNSARCNISDIRHNRPSSTIVLTGTTTNTTARGLDPQGAYTGATQKVFDDQSSGTNTYEGGGKAVATVSNAGATTATAVGVDAVAYSFPFVSKGERFLITANAALVTGGVAGDRLATLHKVAGTATAVFGNNGANVASRSLGGTTGEVDLALTAIMTVTVSGSYQLGLLCQSTGGNSSMAANAAQMTITRL